MEEYLQSTIQVNVYQNAQTFFPQMIGFIGYNIQKEGGNMIFRYGRNVTFKNYFKTQIRSSVMLSGSFCRRLNPLNTK